MIQKENLQAKAGGGPSGYGGNSSGSSKDVSAPEIDNIEFLKNDGTKIDFEEENGKYTNTLTDGEVIVNITYNKEITIEDSSWTLSGNKITKIFKQGGENEVTVKTKAGQTKTITLNLMIDTEYPVIKINKADVETNKIKRIKSVEGRENLEDTPYAGETGRYIDQAIIEVSDDNIDPKEIENYITTFTCNGRSIDFKNEMTLNKLGTYKIVVEDKVGNESTYMFVITTERENIKIDEKNIKKIEKGENEVNVVRITKNKKAIISSDSNTTRQSFESQIKLNVDVEISILNNGKKAVVKNEDGTDPVEAYNNEPIKTGMKLKIADLEYDLVVSGDIDGDGQIEQRDLNLAQYLLAINAKDKDEGIPIDGEWTFDLKELLDNDYGIQIGDFNGDGKIDENDIEEIIAKLDVNEDGEFDEKDQELIKYALDLNDDGMFNEEDIKILREDGLFDLDDEEENTEDDPQETEELANEQEHQDDDEQEEQLETEEN